MKNYLEKRNKGEYSLFDEALDNFFRPLFFSENNSEMKTDIKEFKTNYEMEIEMPGFDKKDISVNLEDGYLNISAQKDVKEKVEHDDGAYLRRERTVSCSRSYYIGDVKEEDIKAKYNNGILCLTIPKCELEKPAKKQISID